MAQGEIPGRDKDRIDPLGSDSECLVCGDKGRKVEEKLSKDLLGLWLVAAVGSHSRLLRFQRVSDYNNDDSHVATDLLLEAG